jgi:hypothetical protein
MDGVKDGTETDKDCGGACSTKCGVGRGCAQGTDCVTGSCVANVCAPTCSDGLKDGSETDIDCGGSCSTKCAFGKGCGIGNDCASGYCNAGSCDAQILGTGPGGANTLTLDAANLYWTVFGSTTGQVLKMPITGGTPVVLANNVAGPRAIAFDAVYVYWSATSGNSIWRGPINSPLMGVAVATGYNAPQGLFVNGSYLYWLDSGDGKAWRSTPSGATPTQLASGVGRHIAVDASYVYTGDPGNTQSLVQRFPLAGGAATTLCTAPQGLDGMAIDGTSVYFSIGQVPGQVMKVPLAGGAAQTVVSGQSAPGSLAVDGTSVYWTNGGDSSVNKAPIGGGTATVLAAAQPGGVGPLAIDATYVYFGAGDGSIRRVHK